MASGARKLSLQAVCAWALHDFGVRLDRAPMWLSEQCAQEICEVGRLYLETYACLAERALFQDRKPLYKVRPKFHSLHCECILKIRAGSRLNPRFTSCFNDEDLSENRAAWGNQLMFLLWRAESWKDSCCKRTLGWLAVGKTQVAFARKCAALILRFSTYIYNHPGVDRRCHFSKKIGSRPKHR